MSKCIVTSKDIQQMPQRYRAEFINSLSGFKSANLVGTTSISGIDNLALVSSVVHIGANPPLLGMIMRPHTVPRDTLQNIKDTGVYTLNSVSESMIERAHQTSARYASDESEFDAVGFNASRSQVVDAPYVKESPLKLSLRVVEILPIQANATEMVVGEIVEVVLAEDCIDKTGYLDIEHLGSMSISGLVSYHKTQRVGAYAYAKPDAAVQPLSLRRSKNI
ncbi:flavin reductase family protein [Alteromonas facilis]|uniref:flavin reductase family protein n=1 Tax=Alteromonas facilis TaxID=2048004 RepID=UPI000C282247|nr:flavin reductase family protein [Alteromonas facilis]